MAYLEYRNTALHVFHKQEKPLKKRENEPIQEFFELRTTLSDISTGDPPKEPQIPFPSSEEASAMNNIPPSLNSASTQPSSHSLQHTAQHVLRQQQQKQPSPRYGMPSPQTLSSQHSSPRSIPTQPPMFVVPQTPPQQFFHAQMMQPVMRPAQQSMMQFPKAASPQMQFPPQSQQQNWQQHNQQQNWQQFSHQTNPMQPNMYNQAPTQMTGAVATPFGTGSPRPTPSLTGSFPSASSPTPPTGFATNTPPTAFAMNSTPTSFVASSPSQFGFANPQFTQAQMVHPQMVQAPQIIQPQMLQQNRVIFQQNVMQPQMMQRPNVVMAAPFQPRMVNPAANGMMTPSSFPQQQQQMPPNVLVNPFQPQMNFVQVNSQQPPPQMQPPQMQMQMPFLPPKPPAMSPTERQAFINLQRLMSTPVGQRLLSNPQVTTKDVMHLIEKDIQQKRQQIPSKQNDQMARAIADRHRENFESTQRDIRDFQKEKSPIQLVEDAKVTEEDEEKNRKEEMEFEFNADNETLESLGESYKDNVALLQKRIEELESLKRSYSGGGFKKMRSVVNTAIRKLRGRLQKLTLEDELEHSLFYPLTTRHRDFTGLEVKFVACPEDCAIVLEDIGFLRTKVRTFGRLACRDTLPRLDKIQGIVRQSREIWAFKIKKNEIFKRHPNICKHIAEYLYYELIPLEITILDQKITYRPEYFPIVWQVYGLIDVTLPEWEKRYFQSFQFKQVENTDMVSNIPLCTIDDAYFQALNRGEKKFVFQMTSKHETTV